MAVAEFDVGNGKTIPVPEDVAPLFTPVKIGRFQLSNRIVYAPLTRCRALGQVPQPCMAEYYAQRTVPGSLLISEATPVAVEGHGYPCTPGIHTAEQIAAWKPVTQAVKGKGGIFFCQLWHTGRASHNDYQPNGALPVAPSPIAVGPQFQVYTIQSGLVEYPVPHELTVPEIKAIVQQFAQGAKNALEAGFDGVEIHGANGYLIDQFLKSDTNKRTDEYGGSVENRARFCLEVVEAVVEAVGADRVGIRITPFARFLNATTSEPYGQHTYVVEKLRDKGLAYVHMVEGRIAGADEGEVKAHEVLSPFRAIYNPGKFIIAGGFKRESAAEAIKSGAADLVCIGRHFLANPDLHKRWLLNAPLNKYDRSTFYTQDPVVGYTDYPALE